MQDYSNSLKASDIRNMKMKCVLVMLLKAHLALSQTCMVSNGDDIPFEDLGSQADHLPNGSQAIVTSYRFQCCGRVTRWQAYMTPGDEQFAIGNITFQVWRPGPAVESDGCYHLVGEDMYVYFAPDGPVRRVNRTVNSSTVISVQPGDVVGYYVPTGGVTEGIQLEERLTGESVWYHMESPFLHISGTCPYQVGEGRSLSSSTNAAPVISVDIATSPCPTSTVLDLVQVSKPPVFPKAANLTSTTHPAATMSAPMTSITYHHSATPQQFAATGSTTPISNGTTMAAHNTSIIYPLDNVSIALLPFPNIPVSGARLSVRNVGIIAGVCVSAVLVVTLGILAAAIAIHRRKAASQNERERFTTEENVAYLTNPVITSDDSHTTGAVTDVNQAYGGKDELQLSTCKRTQNITTSMNDGHVTSTTMNASPAYDEIRFSPCERIATLVNDSYVTSATMKANPAYGQNQLSARRETQNIVTSDNKSYATSAITSANPAYALNHTQHETITSEDDHTSKKPVYDYAYNFN